MTTYVWRNGKCVEKGSAADMRASGAYVISDNMDPIKHMGTGEMMDSKAKFRAATRASGCVEIGNETIKARQPIKLDRRQRREAILRTVYELRNGR